MDTAAIRKFVEENPKLVTRRESEKHKGLFVVKYTRKVFYDALWTPELEECRGLVVDQNWNPVIVPFKKIYNRGERGTDFAPESKGTAVRKVNGFMCAVTRVEEAIIVSTTGSLDSPFVEIAERHITPKMRDMVYKYQGQTFLFEICDDEDRHIIHESSGPYLIGVRDIRTGEMADQRALDSLAIDMTTSRDFMVHRPHWYGGISFHVVCSLCAICQHEGFVVYNGDAALKMKSPWYLVNKFLARVRPERLDIILADESWKQTVDEEFFPLMEHLTAHRSEYPETEQDRLVWLQKYFNGGNRS